MELIAIIGLSISITMLFIAIVGLAHIGDSGPPVAVFTLMMMLLTVALTTVYMEYKAMLNLVPVQ